MFVPLISAPSVERRKLWRRKGGGGGGGKGGGGGGGGKGGGSSGSGKGGGFGSGKGTSVSSGGKAMKASSGSKGTKHVSTIPSGQVFAGRSTGGGTRDKVYGTRAYGSGYPGISGRGTDDRGFPFYYWPLAFGAGGYGYGAGSYLHRSEYGHANNDTRPGGAQLTAAFTSKDLNATYRILSDNATVTSLVQSVVDKCGSSLSTKSITPATYHGSDVDPPQAPQPEQVVQYYRASSVALSLDGYNNTGVLSEDENTQDSPLPVDMDLKLLVCINSTIGTQVPLVSSAVDVFSGGESRMGLVGIGFLIWIISAVV